MGETTGPTLLGVDVLWVATLLSGVAAFAVMLVDALEHPIGTPAVSSTGQATLTVPTTSAAGLYRVKVTAA